MGLNGMYEWCEGEGKGDIGPQPGLGGAVCLEKSEERVTWVMAEDRVWFWYLFSIGLMLGLCVDGVVLLEEAVCVEHE